MVVINQILSEHPQAFVAVCGGRFIGETLVGGKGFKTLEFGIPPRRNGQRQRTFEVDYKMRRARATELRANWASASIALGRL